MLAHLSPAYACHPYGWPYPDDPQFLGGIQAIIIFPSVRFGLNNVYV